MKTKQRILLFLVVLLQLIVLEAVAGGEIKGTVRDKKGETIPFASVILQQNGILVNGATTDIDGNYSIRAEAGSYDLKITALGFASVTNRNVKIEEGKITLADVTLAESVTILSEVVVKTEKVPLKKTSSNNIISRDEIMSMPNVQVAPMVITPGVLSSNDITNVRGSRNGTTVFIDGVKIRNGNTPPDIIPGNIDPPNTEEYAAIEENRFISPFTDPLSTFSIDVDRASYTNVRRFINGGQKPAKDVVRIEEMINYFHYDYPQPENEHPFSINMEMSRCPWNERHHVVLVGLQGKTFRPEELPPSNLVFLIDVSGSMSDANKLPLVKSSIRALVNQLRKEDKVSIVVYAGNAGLVLPPTSGDKKEKILEAIDKLEAGGSTAGGAGIRLAYKQAEESFIKNGNNRVVLATDGDFNVGVSSDDELVKLIEEKRKSGVFLTVLGYGMGNYKDAKMEKLADKGNGNYAYIDTQQEAEKVLVTEFAGTMHAIAKDVKLQLEFNPSIVKSYRLIGYENRQLQDWEFNDDTRDAGELGAGHTVTAIYEVELYETPLTSGLNDSLKYQVTDLSKAAASNEILTIKFRYKLPKEDKSKLIEQVLINTDHKFTDATENLRFAAAVAGFGMMLRDSEYKGNLTYDKVMDMGKDSRGKDEDGYRSEFVQLVKATRNLK